MPFVLDGTSGRTVIESRGIAHTIDFTIDHIHRVPQVRITKAPSFVQNGVSFTLRWTDSPIAQNSTPQRANLYKSFATSPSSILTPRSA
jgi:hypothetical protein